MPRTTVDIDRSVLDDLKRRASAEHKSLGRLISEILAAALKQQEGERDHAEFVWTSRAMRARVDLEDTDSVARRLDEA